MKIATFAELAAMPTGTIWCDVHEGFADSLMQKGETDTEGWFPQQEMLPQILGSDQELKFPAIRKEASIPEELIKPFQPLRTAVTNWRPQIFNYFDHRATNALTEALNGVAKGIQRSGRGYSFPAIRAKMLYSRHLHKTRPRYGEEWDKDVAGQIVQASAPEINLSNLHYASLPAPREPSLGVDIQLLLWEFSTPGAFDRAAPE